LRAWSTSPTTHPRRRRIDHTLPPSQVCRQQHGRLPVGAALYSEPRRDSLRRGVEIYSTATLCMKIHSTISSGDQWRTQEFWFAGANNFGGEKIEAKMQVY
jgi:hypothetical protein